MSTRLFRHYVQGRLVHPSVDVQRELLGESKAFVLARFAPGKTRERSQIAQILNCYFEFFSKRFDSLLRKLGSWELMEFVLYQYDMATAAWRQTPDEVTLDAARQSSELGIVRRSLKFLAERTTMMWPASDFASVRPPNLFRKVEECLFVSRMLADFYLTSDQVFHVMSGEMELSLEEKDELIEGSSWPLPYRLRFHSAQDSDFSFGSRVARDRLNREKYFPEGTANLDFQRQSTILDPAFDASFGVEFSRFLQVIAVINEQAQPAPGGYPVLFFRKDSLVQDIVRNGMNRDIGERILAGFTVRRQHMLEEKRVIYRPNQKYRALRRGYFEFPHRSGPHLFWSASLAREAFDHLLSGVCFKKLPAEWLTRETRAGLDKLSNDAGAWFERHVISQMRSLGIEGEGRKRRVSGFEEKIEIPDEVGQLDFLGFSKRDSAIVIVEAKMVEVGFEGRFFRDEIAEFATGNTCYAAQLRKKFDWVVVNRGAIAKALGAASNDVRVVSALVTLYPTYAASRITDMPCVSLVELMEDYNALGLWPYVIGIR